jgi:anti-sigma B factor antagonist
MPDTLDRPDSIGTRADVSPAFVCSWTDGGRDAAWVHLAGELDIATAPQLEWTLGLDELQARLVVLDLRELVFIDSSGVHAIVKASRSARQAGRRLVLFRGPPSVDRLFALSGSSDDLEIGDLDPGDPPVQVLPQLAQEDLGS